MRSTAHKVEYVHDAEKAEFEIRKSKRQHEKKNYLKCLLDP